MSKPAPRNVVIIGAGIVGVSTAIWLQRAGHDVTLVDRHGPAGGTSYGNAGVLAAGTIVPVPTPGLLKKIPKMVFDRDAPLFMRWRYLPRAIPFLIKFLRAGRHDVVTRISKSLALILHDTVEQHLSLAEGTGAERYITTGDYVYGYRDRAAFEADRYEWDLKRAGGVEFEEMDEAQIAAYDPAMVGRFGFAVRCPHHGRISDPGAYVTALAEHVTENGGRFVKADVQEIVSHGAQASGVRTRDGMIEADDVVVATGAWSAKLCRPLGLNVPLESERGYHIEFVNPSITFRSPVMVTQCKYVLTTMDGRLRCAGIVEIGGLTEERSKAPLDLLKRQTLALYPELTYDRIDEWMGHRPSTTDSLPVIGQVGDLANVWSGFGHQHIGLTAGPKTGRWLAQLISGQTPNVDLSPFKPDRFG